MKSLQVMLGVVQFEDILNLRISVSLPSIAMMTKANAHYDEGFLSFPKAKYANADFGKNNMEALILARLPLLTVCLTLLSDIPVTLAICGEVHPSIDSL